MMQEKATIKGEVYLLVVSPQPAEDSGNTSCVGCAFDEYNNSTGYGCRTVVADTVPACSGNLIFIKDTPNAIAEWVEARLE